MMKRFLNRFLLIGIVWVCCVCSVGYLTLFRPGIGTRWKQEPAPPEALLRLTLGGAGEVIGYASSGSIYELNYGNYGNSSSWQKVTDPSGVAAIGEGCETGNSNRIVVPPPGKVKSRVSESCVYIESAYHLEVALLDNGEIWSWEHESYAYTNLLIIFIVFIAFVIGVLILLTGMGFWMLYD